MKTVAIVQARMASTRLPGKVLMPVLDRPLIIHELERVLRSTSINELWLATSEDSSDDPLAEAVDQRGFRVFRGSQDDVLGRFHDLARQTKADVVVRLTGDCPLHDPQIIDYTISAFLNSRPMVHYASNIWPPTFPHGLDVEVFSFSALDRAAYESTDLVEREHVTPNIHGQFKEEKTPILNVTAPADFSHLRWTLDYMEDYEVIRAVFEALYPDDPEFNWLDVVAYLTKKPELMTHNQRPERNESFAAQLPGYLERMNERKVPELT